MITKDTALNIGHLARLELTDSEAQEMADSLTQILEHFNELSKLETEGVAPMVTPTDMRLELRVDEVVTELTAEEILENAPEKSGNLFKVPPVV